MTFIRIPKLYDFFITLKKIVIALIYKWKKQASCMGGERLLVLGGELLHEGRKLLDTLQGHGIVNRGTHTTNRAMTLELNEVELAGLFDENLLKIRLGGDSEGNVHEGADSRVNGAIVEAVASGDGIVENSSLLLVDLLDGFEATEGKELLEDKTTHVDGPAGGGVVHGIVVGVDLIVQHGRGARASLADKVLADDSNSETSGANVLLGTGVDKTVLGNINGLGAEVGGHIGNESSLDVGSALELNTLDGLIVAVVDILGVSTQLPAINSGDGLIVSLAGKVRLAELLALIEGLLRPGASDNVVNDVALLGKVKRNHRELSRGTTLKEENLVIEGDVQKLAKVSLSPLNNAVELLAAMAHLHDAHAAALPVNKISLSLLKNIHRKHCRASREVINTLGLGSANLHRLANGGGNHTHTSVALDRLNLNLLSKHFSGFN
mmetsp:Transcript_889/g.1216  ORF Transcript_889/g.1216 Transcript_889/m.1216 type:complete len:437 (-) Transcript_889:85-1395(-)